MSDSKPLVFGSERLFPLCMCSSKPTISRISSIRVTSHDLSIAEPPNVASVIIGNENIVLYFILLIKITIETTIKRT